MLLSKHFMAQASAAPAGIPGNDDQAAMASLLSFHLLGLYPGIKPLIHHQHQ